MATDRHSTATEAKPSGTHNTETSSLLSVKQDLSRLASELPGTVITSAVTECEEPSKTASEISSATKKLAGVADLTDGGTEASERVELTDDHEAVHECLEDEHRCCGDTLTSHSEDDKFIKPSSSRHEDDIKSDQLSEVKSKKNSLKRRLSSECSSLTSSPVVKKFQQNADVSTSQLLKTPSGTFVVHEVSRPGENLYSDYNYCEYILIIELRTCQIASTLVCCAHPMFKVLF